MSITPKLNCNTIPFKTKAGFFSFPDIYTILKLNEKGKMFRIILKRIAVAIELSTFKTYYNNITIAPNIFLLLVI